MFHGPKHITTGSKLAKTTCLSIPNGLGTTLEKCGFDLCSSHFLSQNDPFSRHFAIFHGPKRVTTGSKRPENTCLSIPSGLGTTLEKMIFFARGTLVDPPLAPTVRWPGCPPAVPSDHRYRGLGGLLGDSKGWSAQRVGGCGWTRCRRNWVLSHVTQDTARSWFRGVGAYCAAFGVSWRLFGPFRGHIVELGGKKELLLTVKSSRTCSVATVCLRLAMSMGFRGGFGPKEAVLGHKMRSSGRAPPDLAPPPRGATGEFLAENLDLARPPARL